jgi:hypothetical protein
LPIQFKRYLEQKQINETSKLIFESDLLPKDCFIYKDKPYNVKSILQIWASLKNKKYDEFNDLRIKIAPVKSHKDFKLFIHNNTTNTLKYFNKKIYKWNFAVPRQGYYDYSKKITDPNKLIKNRQYLFVKYINPISKEIFKKIDFKKLSESNTSIPGFSNSDVIKEYLTLLEKQA